FRNASHEQQVASLVQEVLGETTGDSPDVFVSSSHEVSPTWGEYERCMTTIINSYVGPRTGKYLDELVAELETRQFTGAFSIMKSDGGTASPGDAARYPVTLIASGPAG